MLNYAADTTTHDAAVFALAWAVARRTEHLPGRLLRGQAPAAFRPEQVSGFCASG